MFDLEQYLEKAWDDLLSRDKDRVIKRFSSLDESSQKNVLEHLQRMATEPGWHSEQSKSAQSALQILSDQDIVTWI